MSSSNMVDKGILIDSTWSALQLETALNQCILISFHKTYGTKYPSEIQIVFEKYSIFSFVSRIFYDG